MRFSFSGEWQAWGDERVMRQLSAHAGMTYYTTLSYALQLDL